MVVRVLRDSGDSGMGCTSQEAEGVEELTASLWRAVTRRAEAYETSDKVARLSKAGYGYETRVRELEHQFESKAAELRVSLDRPANPRIAGAVGGDHGETKLHDYEAKAQDYPVPAND
jgi:hypothetical protein